MAQQPYSCCHGRWHFPTGNCCRSLYLCPNYGKINQIVLISFLILVKIGDVVKQPQHLMYKNAYDLLYFFLDFDVFHKMRNSTNKPLKKIIFVLCLSRKCYFGAIQAFIFNQKRTSFVLAMLSSFSNVGPFLHKGNSFDS